MGCCVCVELLKKEGFFNCAGETAIDWLQLPKFSKFWPQPSTLISSVFQEIRSNTKWGGVLTTRAASEPASLPLLWILVQVQPCRVTTGNNLAPWSMLLLRHNLHPTGPTCSFYTLITRISHLSCCSHISQSLLYAE